MMSQDFQVGAHLRDDRTWYGHDGTYMGDGWVMQYGGGNLSEKGRSRIDFVPLADFGKSGRVTVVEHENQDFEETARRALWLYRHPPPMPYDLIGHNCEHIARWCATGNFNSEQVNGVLVLSTAVGGFLYLPEQASSEWPAVVGILLLLFSGFIVWVSQWGTRRFRQHIALNWPG